MRYGKARYESDDKHFRADAYKVRGYNGIAFHVLGWQVEYGPTELECDECGGKGETRDGEPCDYCQNGWITDLEPDDVRTGRVIVRMVGDDRNIVIDESDLTAIERADYCGECGQIGCGHDGYDRSDEESEQEESEQGESNG